MSTEAEIHMSSMKALAETLGPVEADRFMAAAVVDNVPNLADHLRALPEPLDTNRDTTPLRGASLASLRKLHVKSPSSPSK